MGLMNVEVVVSTSVPPTEKDLDNFRSAASELTTQPDSITVELAGEDAQFFVTTTFEMERMAQSKAVGPIYQEFKFSTADLNGYQYILISCS
jgi:hypothetical protein